MIQKPFRGVQLNRTHPLAKGLVGCWLFNEATGETVFDLSGHGNNGTLENGVVWSGGELEFDGVDDYVGRNAIAEIDYDNPYTISMWVSPNSTQATRTLFLNNPIDSSHRNVLQISTVNNTISFGTYDGSTAQAVASNIVLDNNVFYHIVAVNINHTTKKLYINSVDSTGGSGAPAYSPRLGLFIGGQDDGIRIFNGSIRSVNIYNQAKSAEEVVWLYREPYGMFDKPLGPTLLYAAAAAGVPNAGALMMTMM